MTKFILHGGGETQNREEHNDFFREIIKNLPNKAKVLIVWFAMLDEEIASRHPNYIKYFKDNAGDKDIELKIATEENFIEELRQADAVYFRGGKVDRLLEKVRQYPNFKEELLKKKIVAGSSAGVGFLAEYAYSSTRDVLYEGLGILPIKTSSHYDDSKKEKVKALDKCSGELTLLKEGEFKVVEI